MEKWNLDRQRGNEGGYLRVELWAEQCSRIVNRAFWLGGGNLHRSPRSHVCRDET